MPAAQRHSGVTVVPSTAFGITRAAHAEQPNFSAVKHKRPSSGQPPPPLSQTGPSRCFSGGFGSARAPPALPTREGATSPDAGLQSVPLQTQRPKAQNTTGLGGAGERPAAAGGAHPTLTGGRGRSRAARGGRTPHGAGGGAINPASTAPLPGHGPGLTSEGAGAAAAAGTGRSPAGAAAAAGARPRATGARSPRDDVWIHVTRLRSDGAAPRLRARKAKASP